MPASTNRITLWYALSLVSDCCASLPPGPPGHNPSRARFPRARLDAFQFRARGLINAANHPSTRAAGMAWGDRRCKHTTVELLVVDVIVCVDTQTIAIRGTKPRGKSGMSSGDVRAPALVLVYGNARYGTARWIGVCTAVEMVQWRRSIIWICCKGNVYIM